MRWFEKFRVILLLTVSLSLIGWAQSWQPMLPLNPTLNLNDLCFLSDGLHGWAVGSTGAGGQVYSAVFRTIDGASWSYVPFSDSAYVALSGVCFVNANQGWAVGSGGRIYVTANSGNTWTMQTSPTSRNLSKVCFVDTQHGWACGGWGDNTSYLVIRTTNGGANWQDLSFGSTAYSCDDVYFCDSLNGWICGYDNTINSHIHHTTDGGLNWNRQTVPANLGQVAAIDFPTATKGWATTSSIYAANAGAILHTTDAGATWTIQGYTNLDYNYCLDCQDTMRIAITSSQVLSPTDAQVVVSTNGGNSWSSYPHLFRTYTMGIQYVGGNIWVAGQSSQIIKSTNNGVNWGWNFRAPSWNSIAWRDSLNGYVIAGSDAGIDGYCFRTTDAGNSWFYDAAVPGGKQIIFKNANRGWILKEGNSSGVYRTTNGGTTWAYNSIGTGNWIGGIFFASIDSGWAYGSSGTIRMTSNGGITWNTQNSGTSYYIETAYFINSHEGWAAGGYGGSSGFVQHTTDGGANWTAQTPASSDMLLASCFASSTKGVMGTLNSIVEKTTDGGGNWYFTQNLGHYWMSDIAFKDTLNGWLSAYNYWGSSPGDNGWGFIYATNDGGDSWSQQWVSSRIMTFVNDLGRQSQEQYWACGAHNAVLKYVPPTGVFESRAGMHKAARFQVTPNPFAGQATIRLGGIEHSAKGIELQIYNVSGSLVRSFTLGPMPSALSWNGTDQNGQSIPQGVYFAVAEFEGVTYREKIILVK